MAKVIELGDLETDFSKLKPKSKSKSKTKSEKSSERKKKKSSSSSKSKTDKDVKKKSKKKSKSKDVVTKSDVEKKKKAKRERRGKSLKERAEDKVKGELVHNDAVIMEQHLDSFVEANPYVKEHEQFQQYRNMFDKLSAMASPFEQKCIENASSKDVYALMKIYDQMREVIADIRSLKDVQQMAQVLKDEVLSPLVKANVAELISFYQSVEQHARKTLPEDMILPFVKKLEEHTRNTANGIQENFGNAIFRLEEVLEEQ